MLLLGMMFFSTAPKGAANDAPRCPDGTVSSNNYVEPAGYVYDVDTNARIQGATVWLQRPDGSGDWENVPTGASPAIMVPDTNPQATDVNGQYEWLTLAGSYRVHVTVPGYYPADSIVVSVPPPVFDLNVGLTAMPHPPTASFTESLHTASVNTPISFDPSSSSDTYDAIVLYEWDWTSDGTYDESYNPPAIIMHPFGAVGTYTVTLRVTDAAGNTDTASDSVDITIRTHALSFVQSGAGMNPTVTYHIDGYADVVGAVPFDVWVESGHQITYSYQNTISDGSGTQYVLTAVDPASPQTVTGIITVTGNYKTQYYLTVTSTYGTPGGAGWYDANAPAYATVAPSTVPGTPGTRYIFAGWSGDATGTTSTSNTIIMDGPKTATATWKTRYQVSFALTPSGAGIVIPSSAVYFDSGSPVSISATANQGYTFLAWSSSTSSITFASSSSASTTATINGAGAITATFAYMVSGNRHITLTGSNNVIIISGGNNIIDGTRATSTTIVKTGKGNNLIWLGGGDNIVKRDADGNDIITTGNGNNVITITGKGNNLIITGRGNDKIQITGDGNNIINTGDGDNIVTVSGKGNNLITTGSGNDAVTVGNGNNSIWTGYGNDQITVGNGNNYIDGGTGSDVCVHGTGHNTIKNCEIREI
jgi:uncharacterized repeat protein (TIGR02543 family)